MSFLNQLIWSCDSSLVCGYVAYIDWFLNIESILQYIETYYIAILTKAGGIGRGIDT